MDGRIFHLRNELLENLQRQWTIEEMAKICELSVPHFQKLFKANIKTPPMMHLRDLRLEKARQFLETKFWQIQEIRKAVGMPHDGHFTRDFKDKYAVTPTEYRKLHWREIQAAKAAGN